MKYLIEISKCYMCFSFKSNWTLFVYVFRRSGKVRECEIDRVWLRSTLVSVKLGHRCRRHMYYFQMGTPRKVSRHVAIVYRIVLQYPVGNTAYTSVPSTIFCRHTFCSGVIVKSKLKVDYILFIVYWRHFDWRIFCFDYTCIISSWMYPYITFMEMFQENINKTWLK